MKKVWPSIVIGLLTPVVFIIGEVSLEVRGRTSIQEIVAGSLAVVLYLAFYQFLVAQKGSCGPGAKRPTLVAMTATLLVVFVLIALKEKTHTVWEQGLPMLISGCCGIFAGAALAGRVTLPVVSLKFCRRSLLTCAVLLAAAALVVATGVIPLAKADTFPGATPQRAVPVFWLIAALNLLAATLLGFTAIRATDRSCLSTAAPGLLAFLTFMLACGLTGPAYGYRNHGPAMQTTSILLIFCSAAEFLAAVLLSTTAFLLPELSERRAAPVT